MEEIFALIVLVFATSIGALILWKLFDVTRNSIGKNKSSYDEERFDKLAKAFIQHRNDTDRRLQNIEAILTETDSIPFKDPESDASDEVNGVDEGNSEVRQGHGKSNGDNPQKRYLKNRRRTS